MIIGVEVQLGTPSPYSKCALSSFARVNPVFEETSLHRIARQPERNDKMFARILKMAAANLKFAERGVIERIAPTFALMPT